MKNKILVISAILLVMFFSLATAAANEVNDTGTICELTNEQTIESVDVLKSTENQIDENNSILTAADGDKLSADEGSFKDLQDLINGAEEGSTIYLDKDYAYKDTTTVEFSKSITIVGNGHYLDGQGKDRIFDIELGKQKHVFLNNITFKNGDVTWTSGGAIRCVSERGNEATLDIVDCTFDNNHADDGGAIYAEYVRTNILNCRFTNNAADDHGGAIEFDVRESTIRNCYFENNKAKDYGGAIYFTEHDGDPWELYSRSNVVRDSTFISNQGDYGGAIYTNGCHNEMINCYFYKNHADTDGGAIYAYARVNGNDGVFHCVFLENSAEDDGGAIFAREYYPRIQYSVFDKNTAEVGKDAYMEFCLRSYDYPYKTTDNQDTFASCIFFARDSIFTSFYAVGFTECWFPNGHDIKKDKEWREIYINNEMKLKLEYVKNVDSPYVITGHFTYVQTLPIWFNFPSREFTIETTTGTLNTNKIGFDLNKHSFEYTPNESIHNGEITFKFMSYEYVFKFDQTSPVSFTALQSNVTQATESLTLENDFSYSEAGDSHIGSEGILIDKSLTINGNGHVINGNNRTAFKINNPFANITFNNITFVNCNIPINAINAQKITFNNCTFEQNSENIIISCNCEFNDCQFIDNIANNTSILNIEDFCVLNDCYFLGNIANNTSILNVEGGCVLNNAKFVNNVGGESLILLNSTSNVEINGSIFIQNDADKIIHAKKTLNKLNVTNNIIINSESEYEIYAESQPHECYLDYNWLGNTADNFNSPYKVNLDANTWYFLNMTLMYDYANVSLNNVYDNVNKRVIRNCGYTLPDISIGLYLVNMSSSQGSIDFVDDGEIQIRVYMLSKPAFLTASYENVNYTVNFTQKGEFDLLNDLISLADDNSTIVLDRDYTFTEGIDSVGGITIRATNITIDGNGHTINALGKSLIFTVSGERVTLKNLILVNGGNEDVGGYDGPVVWSGHDGVVDNCTFENNTGALNGAITWAGQNGLIKDSLFKGNVAGDGGALYLQGKNMTVTNTTFTNNRAKSGGAVYVYAIDAAVENCTLRYNTATGDGGAVYWDKKNGKISDCEFENNNAGSEGGAVFWNDVDGVVTGSKFKLNNAKDGGAVYWNKRYGKLSDCELTNNTATNGGGAVFWNANYGTVDSSSFENNTAKSGGAIYWDYDYGKVIDSTFIRNTANEDGGAIYFFEGKFTKNEQHAVDNSIFSKNSAQNNGGAMYIAAKKSSIGNSTFIKNQAKDGGALYATFEGGTISQSVFISNSASDEGSAIYTDEDSTPVNYCVFFEDNAKSIIYHKGSWFSSNVNADYNWWGNNITDFNQKLANVNDDVDVNNWYVLDMTMNEGTANITLNNLFENNKITTDGNCKMPQINITLTNENLTVADSIILGENGYAEVDYLLKAIKGSLKASFETSSVTRSEVFLPSSTTITTTQDEFTYGNITIEYEVINPTIINVTITNETGGIVFENLTSDYIVSPDLTAGIYTITVTNMGNGSIVSSNDTKTFTVNKATPTIMVVTEDVTYPGDVAVNVTSDVAGNYTVKIGNVAEEINLTVNEVKQLTFSGLKAQEYIINVTYDETENYTQAFNDSVKVNVLKADSDVIIKNVTYLDYWNVIVEIELVNSDDFTAKLYQNATEISKITKNQTAIKLNDLTSGDYTLNITTIVDENHTQTTESLNIFVKYTPTINVVTADVVYPGDVIVNATSDATGKFTIKIGDNTFEFNLTEDVKTETFRFKGMEIGEYAINVTYQGNENYTAAFNDTVNVNVLKINTAIDSTVKIDGYHAAITVNVNPNVDGFVYLAYDDFACYLALKNGSASLNNTLPVGNYNVEIKYLGDDLHNESSTSLEFVIVDPAKESTDISLEVISNENDVTYIVDVDSDATGIVKFEVTGTEEYTVYADVINGKAVLDDILDAGDYTVIATYMGDDRFNTNITTQTFTIKGHEKQNTNIDADVNITGYRVTITVNVNQNATGFVRVKLADTVANIELTDGAGSLVTSLAAGSYYVDLTYLGDDDFNENSTALTFTIVDPVKENTPISLDVSSYENDVVYTVKVNSNATGLVKFRVTGTEEYMVYADVIDGKAILVDTLVAGDYTVIATYVGDDKYNANVTSESFTIKGHTKKNTTINADVKINGYLATISVNVNPNATGFVELTTKDSIIYLALKNGVASVNNTLSAGSYNFAIRYIGDDDYNENSTSLEFVIVDPVKENTDIDLNVVIDENDVVYVVDVDSDATGIAKFEVTGTEEYTVYVDVINGKAILEDILVAGDYTVIATYMGDARFNTNITAESFTIKGHVKQDTAIDANVNINGYHVTITVNVDSDATGFVRVKLGDTIANIELTDGTGSLVTTLAAGSYYVDLTYLGDDNYNENSTAVTFTIVDLVKDNTPISLDVSSYENDVVYTVEVNSDATGLVKFRVTGTEEYMVYADVIDGKAILVDILDDGDYTVIATYVGDDKYNANVTSESFTIKGHTKQNTTINADVKINGYLVTINVNVNPNATGFVELTSRDSIIYLALENGVASLSNTLSAGSYNIAVRYIGDDNYNENSTSLEFVIVDPVKENTSIELDVSSVEDYATFVVNVNSNATGIVRFVVSGTEDYTVYADVINGVAVMEDFLTPGDYTVVATYMGDDIFNSNITSESFTIQGHVKKDTPIRADAKVNGNRVTITVNVDENATGFVSLRQSGSVMYIAVENGVATYTDVLPAGSYNVEVTYLGDDDYNENGTRVLFTVVEAAKKNTTVELDVSSIENNVTFTVNVDSDATGIVKFEVSGGEEYVVYADVINGIAVMNDVLATGDYTVVATYMGDDMFNSNSIVEYFTVSGHVMLNVTINCNVAVDGYEVAVTVVLNEYSATGFVEFNIAGKKYYAPVNDGKAILVADFLAGTYMGKVFYLGDDNFNGNMSIVSFTVVEQNVTLENTSIEIVVGAMENDVCIIAKVNESATGLVEFVIDGNAVYIAVNNGEAVYDVVLAGGDYNVTATYLGDFRFNPNSTAKEFTVRDHVKLNTTITSDVVIDGHIVVVTVQVDLDATGFVGFTIENETMYAKIDNGTAVMQLGVNQVGNYTLTVTYLGDEEFNPNSTDVTFEIVDVLKNTSVTADIEIFDNNITITVNVDSNATGFVEFDVTGAEEYIVYVALKDGKAILDDVLIAGDYTVLITYLGDNQFNANSTVEEFTVVGHIKKDTFINAVPEVDERTVSIEVGVDENATGYVTIAVLGQTFIVPVENGKALFSYDFLPGTYNASVVYLGDDNFNNASTSVSFTVIKQDVKLKNTTISVDVDAVENDVTITVKVDSSASGLIEFNIDGNAVYLVVNNGVATFNTNLPAGDYNVIVTYMGDEKFNANSTSKEFAVVDHIKKNTSIFADVSVDGSLATIDVEVDYNASGFVEFDIGGEVVYITVKDGKAKYSIVLPDGNYAASIKYLGDNDFNANSTVKEFTVSHVVPIASEFSEITVCDKVITAVLKDANGVPIANANVTYTMGGMTVNAMTDSNGAVAIENATGSVELKYAGNEGILPTSFSVTLKGISPAIVRTESRFNITGNSITIKGYAIDKKAGETGMTYATELLDINGNPISNVTIQFAINDKIHSRVTYENGSFEPY
ncbi:Ig-like domain repeat protein, partial [Methanobrevibacter sp.]|uniref:Ig-like domain repeat protein n=1 Tax=Methanobrevibacter sp. TaxID=66852 RepID=UPI0025F4976D